MSFYNETYKKKIIDKIKEELQEKIKQKKIKDNDLLDIVNKNEVQENTFEYILHTQLIHKDIPILYKPFNSVDENLNYINYLDEDINNIPTGSIQDVLEQFMNLYQQNNIQSGGYEISNIGSLKFD